MSNKDAESESFWCPGCDREVDKKEGISLDGYIIGTCQACWATMRPFERILLHLLSTTGFDAGETPGLGIAFELGEIREMLMKATRG